MYVIVVSPAPSLPWLTRIHDAVLAAVHGQPGLAFTESVPAPPAAPIERVTGSMAYVHDDPGGAAGEGAACVIVNVCPAIVTVPVRLGPVFDAAETLTFPLPVPLTADEITIQPAWLAHTQAH